MQEFPYQPCYMPLHHCLHTVVPSVSSAGMMAGLSDLALSPLEVMIAALSPAEFNYEETLSTLLLLSRLRVPGSGVAVVRDKPAQIEL